MSKLGIDIRPHYIFTYNSNSIEFGTKQIFYYWRKGKSLHYKMLDNGVEGDRNVCILIFTLLQMDTSIRYGELQREVLEKYGDRYPELLLNDWQNFIGECISMVRNIALTEAKEVLMKHNQLNMAVEGSVDTN